MKNPTEEQIDEAILNLQVSFSHGTYKYTCRIAPLYRVLASSWRNTDKKALTELKDLVAEELEMHP